MPGALILMLIAQQVHAADLGTSVSDADDGIGFSLDGTYLLSATRLGDLRVDADGDGQGTTRESFGQDVLVLHRLRFTPSLQVADRFSLHTDLQLAAGFLAASGPAPRFAGYGAPRGEGASAFGADQRWTDQLKIRKAYVKLRTPVGVVLGGRMASNWGLGMLVNSGDHELQDWGGTRFGEDRNFGDVVNRIILATRPLLLAGDLEWAHRWTLALGGDLVERDERTDRSEDDVAWEGIGALRYQDDHREAGIYTAYRDLEDRNQETLNVWIIDLFAQGSWRFGDLEVRGAGELAWVTGDTTMARNNAFTGEIDVKQLGYVVRAGATYLPFDIGLDVEVGYASGDSNPYDGNLRNFTFDPNYNPSLILFEELRAAESVAAAANASDPERVGIPPDSVRLLPTNGSVSNAIYVRPTLRGSFKKLLPAELGQMSARLALLYALAEEDLVDPFASTLEGGIAINHQGGDGQERQLGLEANIGLDYHIQLETWVALDATLQAGRLWPGKGFQNAAGLDHPSVDVFYARLAVHWLPPAPSPSP